MKVQQKPIDEIIPYARNPRKNEGAIAKVAASIKEFGWQQPIVVDSEMVVVAGHTRLQAANKLNLKKVPIVVADNLTPTQVKAYRLADNRVSEESCWDSELLGLELQELLQENYEIEITGFDQTELDKLLINNEEYLTDEDEVPEPPKEPITKLGNIWQLGNHRLMCGHSTKEEDIKKLCINPIDLLLTDPPYNIDYEGGSKKRDKIANDKINNFREFLTLCFYNAGSVMKAGASYYIWYADTESYNVRGSVMDVGWTIRQNLIWNKDNSTFGRSDYHWKHEPCLYGWIDGASHNWMGDRKQTTVIEFKRPSKSKLHPTMKPVGLMEYQITNNTKGLDIVLDLFGGSGSTLIACEKTNRKCYMMELDPNYVDVIIQRWQNFTGKKAVHVETGKSFDD